MKIYAPVKDANGVWCSVRFVNGVGETDVPHLIEWFKRHGYKVEETKEETVAVVGNIVDDSEFVEINELADDEPDFDSMTPNELRDWMKANGLGREIKNIRNKEKLLEIIRG